MNYLSVMGYMTHSHSVNLRKHVVRTYSTLTVQQIEQMRCLSAVMALCLLLHSAVSLSLMSGSPIALNIWKLPYNYNASHPPALNSLQPGRTKEVFFREVLGLEPGKPFLFSIDRWRLLQSCGLFYNLTASSTTTPDDKVQLVIAGFEKPSISFSPEVTLLASIESPQIMGGVTLKDSNFRGVGETLRVTMKKTDSIDDATMKTLEPTEFSLDWRDNRVGKTSCISLSLDSQRAVEQTRNLFDRYILRSLSKLIVQGEEGGGEQSTATVMRDMTHYSIQTFGVKLQDSVLLDNVLVKYGLEPFQRAMSFQRAAWTGVRNFVDADHKSGLSAKSWFESGGLRLANSDAIENFQQAGISLASPTMVVSLRNTTRQLASLAKLRLKGVRAWGRGCSPLEHYSTLGSPKVVRGYYGLVADQDLTAHTIDGFASLKTDVYLDGLLPAGAIVGLFADAALYKDKDSVGNKGESERLKRVHTAGLSLRLAGFRIDVGAPIHRHMLSRAPKVVLGVDLGD